MGQYHTLYRKEVKKKIVLYMPPNKRTVALETVMIEMAKHHHIILLTLSDRGDIHAYLGSKSIECFSTNIQESNPFLRIIKQTIFLIQFCRKHNADVLWSHLHPCNLYAVIAQYFISAKVIIFRHHFHAQIKNSDTFGLNRNELWMERVISFLAKRIIVPSREVYQGMIEYEGISAKKVEIIPYMYNFKFYAQPNQAEVESIKKLYPSRLRILIAMRMIKLKRHMLVLPILNELVLEGYDLQVLILDDGEERDPIKHYIASNGLSDRLHVLGYRKNIIDYISACDVVLHPSSTEASSSLIKEAGLLEKIVIVNEGVGDFSDYIENEVNGFLIRNEDPLEQGYKAALKKIYNERENCTNFGSELRKRVLNEFGVSEKVSNMYLKLV